MNEETKDGSQHGLVVEDWPIEKIKPYKKNAKNHNVEGISSSISQFGIDQPIVVDKNGVIIKGHGRLKAAQKNGLKTFPVVVSSHLTDEQVRLARLADNRLVEMGGWDLEALKLELPELKLDFPDLSYDVLGLGDDWLHDITHDANKELLPQVAPEAKEKAKREAGKVDIIFTIVKGGYCCMAVASGWKYGIQSPHTPCENARMHPQSNHKLSFIDNNYFDFDWTAHLNHVKEYRPKYATVMDVITKDQAKTSGVKNVYPLEQILDWAEELNQYAENVIVIPKYDCIDRIPEKFMLGYSVPTSHGGTPLPTSAFKGRRVHLLGGSPDAQVKHYEALPDEVVSIDNNYIFRISEFGNFWLCPGKTISLTEFFGQRLDVSNHRMICLSLSLGAMASYFRKAGVADGNDTQFGGTRDAE